MSSNAEDQVELVSRAVVNRETRALFLQDPQGYARQRNVELDDEFVDSVVEGILGVEKDAIDVHARNPFLVDKIGMVKDRYGAGRLKDVVADVGGRITDAGPVIRDGGAHMNAATVAAGAAVVSAAAAVVSAAVAVYDSTKFAGRDVAFDVIRPERGIAVGRSIGAINADITRGMRFDPGLKGTSIGRFR